MPLAPLRDLLAAARTAGYALCYCESWNLESFQAVVEAAEELQSPVIAGFNGGFLKHASRRKPERPPAMQACGWLWRKARFRSPLS